MTFLYNLFISVYVLGVRTASIWNSKARQWINGRQKTFEELNQKIQPDSKIIWVHCSSAGEFEQAKPIIKTLKEQYGGYKIVVSFFSPSGYAVAKNYPFADHICYLPVDSKKNANRFISAIHPSLVIFVKYDFWYYYLSTVSCMKIPLLLVSAVFRKDQVFFKGYGNFYRKILFYFNVIFVQDKSSEDLLKKSDYTNIILTGDTRFDRVKEIAATADEVPMIKEFIANEAAIICGSTWADDEEMLQPAVKRNNLKLIIAPHEINESHLKQIENLFEGAVRYSDYLKTKIAGKILIIDNVGILSRLYMYGTITYVGGGFTRDGIHNILEAAVFGKPVIFGPNYQKYREAKELISTGGAFSISNEKELAGLINTLLENNNLLQNAGTASTKYINENTGATKKVMDYIQANRLLTN